MRFIVKFDKEFDKFLDRLSGEQKDYLMLRATQFWALKLEQEVVKNIDKGGITDTGYLKKSVSISPHRENGAIGYKVMANANYSRIVEEGSRPHWIGNDTEAGKSLRRWVERKLRPDNVGRAFYLIRRKIAKKGTKAHPYFEPAVEWLYKHVSELGESFAKFLGIIK